MIKASTPEKHFIFNMIREMMENRNSALWYGTEIEEKPVEYAGKLFIDSITYNGVINFGNVKIPEEMKDIRSWCWWPTIYSECIMLHHLFNDDYSEENIEMIESLKTEGPYCCEEVVVEKGDIVIDAGAFIGEWSAVASDMGGKVYAFEPSPTYQEMLNKCAENNNFIPVEMGLGDRTGSFNFEPNTYPGTDMFAYGGKHIAKMTTLDQFREEKNIHIDFIKSDVEGFERYLLVGSINTLREDEPKLSIRTYHNNGEDKVVLPKLIKDINPKYKIIERVKTLYAYIP